MYTTKLVSMVVWCFTMVLLIHVPFTGAQGQPSSPDQLLYGAAYMHNERRVLEQQFNDTPTSSSSSTVTTIHTYISQLWTLDRPPLTSWWGNSTSTILHTLLNACASNAPFRRRGFPLSAPSRQLSAILIMTKTHPFSCS